MESFHGTRRDECLNRERVDTRLEAQILIEGWRREYHQIRSHSALGDRPPAPESLENGPPHPAQWGKSKAPSTHGTTGTRIGAMSHPLTEVPLP